MFEITFSSFLCLYNIKHLNKKQHFLFIFLFVFCLFCLEKIVFYDTIKGELSLEKNYFMKEESSYEQKTTIRKNFRYVKD